MAADSAWKQLKLIRTGYITIEVQSLETSAAKVESIAGGLDGLIAGTQSDQSQYSTPSKRITLKVPTANFDAVMKQMRALGRVNHEQISTEDVTKAYADLETRLSVKRQTAQRFRDLLAARTGNLAEVLSVERELGRITSEIELIEGERRYYDNRITVSTIEVELRQEEAMILSEVFAPIPQAFKNSFAVLAKSVSTIIYLTVFLLPWALAAGFSWWMFRTYQKRARKSVA